MGVTALLVVLVTLLAERLGPRLSGIFGTLPIITCVVLSFAQQHARGCAGPRGHAGDRNIPVLSFVVFFVFVGEAIGTLGITRAYVVATAVTVGASLTTAMLDRRLAQSF